MAVMDHIKIASTELLKAADLVKVEIENLRKQKTNLQRDLENQIAEHLRQIQHFEFESRHNDNPGRVPQVQAMIVRLQQEVSDMRAQLRSQQNDIENAIQQKSGMVTGLESQARAILP